jgi:hypothetical protein
VPSPSKRKSLVIATTILFTLFGSAAAATATSGIATSATAISGDETDIEITDETIYGYDLENDPSECINFLPRPNCGKKPESAGDRGGALQYTVFAVILAGVGIIGTVITRNVIRRDRAVNAELERKNSEVKNQTDA